MDENAQTETVAGSDSPDAVTPPAASTATDIDKLRADLNRANKSDAERRVALKAAQDELTALKAAQATAAQTALAEQGKFQELYEAEQKRAADLEKQAAALNDRIRAQELAALRQRIANDKKIPLALADRLQGETAEEISADADKLLEALPRPSAASLNGGERGLPGSGLSTADAKQIAGRFNINPRYLEDN